MKDGNQAGILLSQPAWKEPMHGNLSALLADTLLVLLGLFGVAQCTVSAFSIPVKPIFLSICIALFAFLFLAIFSLKRWRMPILLILSAAYCVTAYLLRTYFLQGFVISTNQVLSTISDNSRFDLPQFRVNLPVGEYTNACSVFLAFVLFFLACYVCWAVRRHSFWLALLGTAPFLLVPLGFTITPAWPSVLMLLGFWATLLLSRLCANSSFGRTAAAGRVALLVLPAVALCLIAMSILMPQDTYTRPASIESLRQELEGGIYRSSLFSQQNGALGRVSLDSAGNRQYTGQTVLRVHNPSKTPLYLHAFSGSVYTGVSWESLPDSTYAELENSLYFNPQNMAGQLLSFYSLPEEQSLLMEIQVENVAANRNCIYAPYGLASRPEELSGTAFVHDAYIRVTSPFGISDYTLQAWDIPHFPRAVNLNLISEPFYSAEAAYRSFANTYYTQLPQNLREKLQWYCTQVGIPDAETAGQEAVIYAIANLVRTSGEYTLSPGTTPEGRDFVDYFLFENQKGYCVHFASAAVALLRSQGIPARYAEGYAVTAMDYDEEGWADIPDQHAHAWAEVYTPGLGWQPLEVTPGVRLSTGELNQQAQDALSEDSGTPESEAESSSEPESSSPESSSALEDSSALGSDETTGAIPFDFRTLQHVLAGIGVAGGAVLLVVLRRIFLIKRRKKRFHSANVNQSAIAIYKYLTDLTSFGASIDPYSEELALKAKFSQHTLTEEEMNALLSDADRAAHETYRTLPVARKLFFKYGKCLL